MYFSSRVVLDVRLILVCRTRTGSFQELASRVYAYQAGAAPLVPRSAPIGNGGTDWQNGSWPFKLLEGSVAQQGLRHCLSQAGASPYGARRWPFPLAPVYNGGKSNSSVALSLPR